MIKANELRTGNWFDFNGRPMQVRPITINDIFYGKIYEPLPLTEEWLIKFGFKKNTDNGDLKGNDCYYTHNNFKRCISLPNFIYDGIKIKYVHQLQNLYFSLTGEELEVNND